MMRQFELQHGSSRLITWLKDDKRLKVGARLTLKDFHMPDVLWLITWRSNTTLEPHQIHREWNNNI